MQQVAHSTHQTLFGRGYACLLRLKLVGLYEAKFDALCLTPLRERIDDQLRAIVTVNCFRAPVYSMSCSVGTVANFPMRSEIASLRKFDYTTLLLSSGIHVPITQLAIPLSRAFT